jgi:glycerol-3-phosphate acyltransferase PlsY
VLFIDFVKGFGAVFFSGSLYGQVFGPMATAGIGAVVGHNFPLWLRFKGGRGLATAAGVMSMLCLPAVGIWIAGWVLGFSFMRKVNLSNVFATVGLVILLFVVSDDVLQSAVAEHPPAGSFRLFGSVLFFTILLKHIEPLRNHFFTRPGNQQVSEESP